jgi:hypothetical protein
MGAGREVAYKQEMFTDASALIAPNLASDASGYSLSLASALARS